MQLFEGTLAIILSTFLLVLIITVSQSIRSRSELLNSIEKDLTVERNILRICRQNSQDVNSMLKEIVGFLNSNGVKWLTIELFSEKKGKIFIENKNILNIAAKREAKYVRVVKISSEDTMYFTIRVEE